MCGIVAAAAGNNIVPVLVEGLKKLEYRGYDSAGLAVISGNDIERIRSVGRVAELGSVEVNALMAIERYSHVIHIVSNVRGKLAAGKTPFDLFVSAFPAGTVSGAPKIRAMQIISELEPEKRGL